MVNEIYYNSISNFCLFSFHEFFSSFYSLAVHPNKLLIATGQATGHDRREGRVRNIFFLQKINIQLIQSSKKIYKKIFLQLLCWHGNQGMLKTKCQCYQFKSVLFFVIM